MVGVKLCEIKPGIRWEARQHKENKIWLLNSNGNNIQLTWHDHASSWMDIKPNVEEGKNFLKKVISTYFWSYKSPGSHRNIKMTWCIKSWISIAIRCRHREQVMIIEHSRLGVDNLFLVLCRSTITISLMVPERICSLAERIRVVSLKTSEVRAALF